jgi:hypothetical protein
LFRYRRLLPRLAALLRLARGGGGGRRHTFLLARGWLLLLLLHLGLEHLLQRGGSSSEPLG